MSSDNRLSVSAEGLEAMSKLDETGYFCLGNSGEFSTSRTDLYLIATAIGYDSAPLKPSGPLKGIIREASVDSSAKAILTALYAVELGLDTELKGIDDIGEVFQNSVDYANCGLVALGDYCDSKSESSLMYEWIADLNEKHQSLFGDEMA